jgi:hypothetical protein
MFSKAVCCIWLLLGLGLAPASTQDKGSLLDGIEHSIRQAKPDWRFASKRVSKNKKHGTYRWEKGKSYVNILIFVHNSAAEATKTYHNFDLEAFGLKRKVLEGRVVDLGDESYAWVGSNDVTTTGIDFRKGNVFVHLTAPTIEGAKEFALLIADAVPSS